MTKMIYHSEFEYYGFKIEEIGPFLLKHGISIDLSGSTGDKPPQAAASWPYWKETLALHPSLTLREVASAFAGIDLHSTSWISDDEGAELNRWLEIIRRAVSANEIEFYPLSDTWSSQMELESADFEPAELQKWCNKKRIGYPLPTIMPLPQTDEGLREALAIAEADRAKLKIRVTDLEAQKDQRAQLQAEIDKLRGELRGKAEDVAALQAANRKLKSDTLEGKTRSTAAKIIGGIVKTMYGMDIHADRLEGIGEVREDIQKAGTDVDEKTLRGWIKEAANVIDRNGKPG